MAGAIQNIEVEVEDELGNKISDIKQKETSISINLIYHLFSIRYQGKCSNLRAPRPASRVQKGQVF